MAILDKAKSATGHAGLPLGPAFLRRFGRAEPHYRQ